MGSPSFITAVDVFAPIYAWDVVHSQGALCTFECEAHRSRSLLKVYGAYVFHEGWLLNHNEAYELFCRKAFKSDDSSSNVVELILEVLKYV